ncbi:hypothetical protein EDC04DRAFT_2750147 [Pisolithus marmoratus]|nr:hypothetical protein EDC04DRAFT_2750147 [Pisolithus marmoratus]
MHSSVSSSLMLSIHLWVVLLIVDDAMVKGLSIIDKRWIYVHAGMTGNQVFNIIFLNIR